MNTLRQTDFNNLLSVLNRQVSERPTLFEFYLNAPLNRKLSGPAFTVDPAPLAQMHLLIACFQAAGYDYVPVYGSSLNFSEGFLNDTQPFWFPRSIDTEHGGFLHCLDRDGTLLDTDNSMWVTSPSCGERHVTPAAVPPPADPWCGLSTLDSSPYRSQL